MNLRNSRIFLTIILLIGSGVTQLPAAGQDLSSIDIPYSKHVLANGLTVLVHEDHSSPQVFVSVYYKVGSRDEAPGKTGFAHLFEHLMFNGSENFEAGMYGPIQELGGQMNGDTWYDRTRYYQTVPSTALDRVLWLESDRMGHLLGAVTQEKLDQQRGVVQNEKRSGDNRPYAKTQYNVLSGLFPEGHPYSWSTIGSMADLGAASLDDVHAWFKRFYGAANAIIVVAGAADTEKVIESVERHFGSIAPGPMVSRLDDWVPERDHNTTEIMQDQAANPALIRAWAAPGRDQEEFEYLTIATQILGGDKSSRLYRALVEEAGLATNVRFGANGHELASMPKLQIELFPNADPNIVQQLVDAEMQRFFEKGPTRQELLLTKTSFAANKIRQLDAVRDRAATIVESEFFLGSPDAYKDQFRTYENATVEDVRTAAQDWLSDGYHQITVVPFGSHSLASDDVDRSRLPAVDEFPEATAPEIIDLVLKNGVSVRFVHRTGVPAVNIVARFGGGFSLEGLYGAGIPSVTLTALQKGTESRDAEEVQNDLKASGSVLRSRISNDDTVVRLSTLSSKLDQAVDLFADVIRNPAFRPDDIDSVRKAEIASIDSSKANPALLTNRYLKWLAYGESHPYGVIPADSDALAAITGTTVKSFHQQVYRPENLQLFVVGQIDEEKLLTTLNKHLGGWRVEGDSGDLPDVNVPAAGSPPRIILFDTPGAPQSNILAYQPVPAPNGEHYDAFQLANWIYGGGSSSRLNQNIRQEKGWSYGVRSAVSEAKGPRLWSVMAPVQTDKTVATIEEIRRELAEMLDGNRVSGDELKDVQNLAIRGLAGQLSGADQILDYLVTISVNGYSDNYIETRKKTFSSLTTSSVTEALTHHLSIDSLNWVIAGDLSRIEEEVRGLGLGDVEVWTNDGTRLR